MQPEQTPSPQSQPEQTLRQEALASPEEMTAPQIAQEIHNRLPTIQVLRRRYIASREANPNIQKAAA